jgi:hypothetical protein
MRQKQQVYMIIYQYCDKDYSVIAIMKKLDKAYRYICKKHYTNVACNLVELIEDDYYDCIDSKCDDDSMNILYCNQFDYYNLETYNIDNISPYMIVSMTLKK